MSTPTELNRPLSADGASNVAERTAFDGTVSAVLLDSRTGERFRALGGLEPEALAYTNTREYDAFTWFVLGWASALDANRLEERFADSPSHPSDTNR